MAKKIEQPIVKWSIVGEDDTPTEGVCAHFVDSKCTKEHYSPHKLPDKLAAKRYKLKSPLYDGSLYMFVVDDVVNGELRPVEVFFEAKKMDSYPWVKFSARIISGMFRQPGPFKSFVIDELCETEAPNGSYHIPGGGGMVGSIVAHAGQVLRKHCQELGLMEAPVLSAVQEEFIDKKRVEMGIEGSDYPDYATECVKCHEKAVVQMDGCGVCLACSDSKCS